MKKKSIVCVVSAMVMLIITIATVAASVRYTNIKQLAVSLEINSFGVATVTGSVDTWDEDEEVEIDLTLLRLETDYEYYYSWKTAKGINGTCGASGTKTVPKGTYILQMNVRIYENGVVVEETTKYSRSQSRS